MLVFLLLMAIAGVVIVVFMLESGHTQFQRFQRHNDGDGLIRGREGDLP